MNTTYRNIEHQNRDGTAMQEKKPQTIILLLN